MLAKWKEPQRTKRTILILFFQEWMGLTMGRRKKGRKKINRNGTCIGVCISFSLERYTERAWTIWPMCLVCFCFSHSKTYVIVACIRATFVNDEFHLLFDLVNSSVKVTKQRRQNPIREKKKKRIRSYLPFKTKANSHSHTNGKSWKMLKHEKDCLRAMRAKWNEKFDRRMNSWKKNYNGQIPVQTDIVRITATPCTKGEKMESR